MIVSIGKWKNDLLPNHIRRGQSETVLRYLIIYLLIHQSASAGERPDILVIIGSDQGWGDLSIQGSKDVETPNLDVLGESGIELKRFYATPIGATTRASLLTGRYHYRTGASGDTNGEHVMNSFETTIGELFQKSGYRTGFFGEWENGANWPHCAKAQGFAVGEEVNSEKVREFFRRNEDEEPGFAIVSCEGFLEADALIGELEAIVKSENTVLFYLSDNGPTIEKGKRFNAYLYGERGSVHEGGVRVPCLVSWPGKIPAGSHFDRITTVIDVFPTLAEIAGLQPSEEVELDGKNLLPVLESGGKPRRWPNRILFTSSTPPGFDLKNAAVSVRTDRWLTVRDAKWCRDEGKAAEFNGWELYDLVADPFEKYNVSTDYPFLISDMKADFSFWMDQTTRFELKNIPTEIGHPEWPLVTLRAGDRDAMGMWSVKVVNEGNYQIRLESGDGGTIELSGEAKTVPGNFVLKSGEFEISTKAESDLIIEPAD